MLGEEVIREVELANPTLKAINYWVSLDGSKDFTTNSCGNAEFDCIRIEPRQKILFRVKFSARHSIPVEARLTFTNKKEGNVRV